MPIKITLTTDIIIENAKANIDKIFCAIGNWNKQIELEVSNGVIKNY